MNRSIQFLHNNTISFLVNSSYFLEKYVLIVAYIIIIQGKTKLGTDDFILLVVLNYCLIAVAKM